MPSVKASKEAKKTVDWRKIRIDQTPGACRVKIGKGQMLDLGGIVKGWSDTEILAAVAQTSIKSAMIVLGGNTAVYGKPEYGEKWLIGIPRSSEDDEYVGYIKLGSMDAVTTSGSAQRRIKKDGKVYGHIMNAKTGRSAESDFDYVTVADADGARGDALSTALYVMGREKAEAFLKAHPDVRAFLLLKGGREALVSKGFADTVFVREEELKLLER